MNPATYLIRGHVYDMSYHALAEAHDAIRLRVGLLFEPAPAVVGADMAVVGTVGDRAWNEISRLLSTINRLEYSIRIKAVLGQRHDPDRKARLRARKEREAPLWLVSMGMDQRLWQHRITED